jgi:hypothetical protein
MPELGSNKNVSVIERAIRVYLTLLNEVEPDCRLKEHCHAYAEDNDPPADGDCALDRDQYLGRPRSGENTVEQVTVSRALQK